MVDSYSLVIYGWFWSNCVILIASIGTLGELCKLEFRVPLCFQLVGLMLTSVSFGLLSNVLTYFSSGEDPPISEKVAGPVIALCLSIINGAFIA